MGGALTDAVWIFAAVLVAIILAAAVLASRRYLLERSGGTVECGLRCPVGSGAWRLGVLAYQHDSLSWHGALGVLLRPEYVFHRRALGVVSRRPAEPAEAVALGADRIIVEIAAGPAPDGSRLVPGENVELAMTEQALTGFLAWLEASPPGSHLGEISLAFKDRGQLRVAGGGGIAARSSAADITRSAVRRRAAHPLPPPASLSTGCKDAADASLAGADASVLVQHRRTAPVSAGIIAKIPGIAKALVRHSAHFLTRCPNLAH